jgi:mannose-6-phosphate isomerase-like protein (cupin superfamily)/rhodanese-related sulfurtransferase
MAPQITRDELRSAIEAGEVTVIDALPPAPFGQRHLPGALNVVAEDSDEQVRTALPDAGAAIVTYSTDSACDRGPGLAERLEAMGYTDVRLYREGIEDWVAAGLPLETPVLERFDLADMHVSPTAALFEGGGRGAGISMFVTRTPPGKFVPLHVHPYPETFLLLEGGGRWTVGEEAVELEPDQLLVVPPDTPRGFRNTGERPLLVVSVHERGTLEQAWLDQEPL